MKPERRYQIGSYSRKRATAHLTVEVVDENGIIVKLGDNDITPNSKQINEKGFNRLDNP